MIFRSSAEDADATVFAKHFRDDAEEFWEEALGEFSDNHDRLDSSEFVRGFAEGALAVWEEVQSEI